MSSKTLKLIRQYHRILKEQGEDPNAAPSPDVTENPEPPVDQGTVPMTSEGENEYIADLIDAALFEPSPEEARTLINLQSVMKMKRYKNAREEILPTVLGIISPSSQAGDMSKALNQLD